MITYEDASLFRLQQLKERIGKADPKQIVQTIGVDLYRSIKNDVRLWKVWNERISYFENLAKNKDILKYEQVALLATKKVVTLLLKIVDSIPKHDEQKYGFFFTPDVKYDYPEETEPTLKEKLKVYLDSKNYFSVKDQGKFIVSSSGRVWYLRDSPTDVGSLHNCNRVLNQHRGIYKFVQEFVKTKIYDEIVRGNRSKEEELGEAFQELAEAIEPIELKLLTDARALHTGEFERVQLTASAFDYSVLGRITKGFESLDKNEKEIEKIRIASILVCEELSYELLLKVRQAELDSLPPQQKKRQTNTYRSNLFPKSEDSLVPSAIANSKPEVQEALVPLSSKSTRKSNRHTLEGLKYLFGGQIEIIKSNIQKSTNLKKTEKELCKAVFENTKTEGDSLSWDELYQLMEGSEPLDERSKEEKKKMVKWRKKITDTRLRVNEAVTKLAGRRIEVIRLVKGETGFIRGIN